MQPISGQQLCKHTPAATDTNATLEEWCFLCGWCQEVKTMTAGAITSAEKRWCYN
jgi:hypothetical protein